jgi:hypothetical protein
MKIVHGRKQTFGNEEKRKTEATAESGERSQDRTQPKRGKGDPRKKREVKAKAGTDPTFQRKSGKAGAFGQKRSKRVIGGIAIFRYETRQAAEE